MKIFSGSSHPEFAKKICDKLSVPLGQSESFTFSNDNRFIKINEPVRGEDVFVIQTSCAPVDTHLMELLMLVRALKNSSARRITAVIPYFPYVRSDKKDQPRICITARLVADLLETAGVKRVLIMEMHSPQLQGFFSSVCDHLDAAPTMIKHLKENWDLNNYVIVAADAGAAKMVKAYSDALNLPVAIMDKRRDSNTEKPIIKGVIGDVKGKKALIIDDEVASGGTLVKDAEFLVGLAGAKSVDACITHPVLGAGAISTLNGSPINRLLVSDTIPSNQHDIKNKEVVSMTSVFAEAIRRIDNDESIRSLNEPV